VLYRSLIGAVALTLGCRVEARGRSMTQSIPT
jgi:hypothetical protein